MSETADSTEVRQAQLRVAKYMVSRWLVIGSGPQADPSESDMALIGADVDGPAWVRGVFFALADAACETEEDWISLLFDIALGSTKRVVEVLNGDL